MLARVTSARPNLFAFLDYRRYLALWFEWKKTANPRFSHRAFARMAGLRSPSLLLHVIDGQRNLTPVTTEGFSRALAHTGEEKDFFAHLVRFQQAETIDERNQALAHLTATRRFRDAHHLEGEGFRFLSHWYYPVIHEMARCTGFRPDPAWIARACKPRITPAQARQALDELLSLGLLVEEVGHLRPKDASVVTPHEVEGLAVANYHTGMIDRARDALTEVASEDRHYLGVSVAIPPSLMPRLKEELNRFQERLLDLCDGAEASRERVVQLNLQLFPLCEDTARVKP
jgi:uncharacterized protein (TIGR02147 family)